jgi:hypothetical protein
VALWAVVTAVTEAVNPALVAPAGTVTEPGTVTAELLLDRLTASPPVPAAAERLTVQLSLPAPVNEFCAQLSPLSAPTVAWPVPLKLMVALLGEALSLRLMLPLVAPLAVGVKVTERLAVWPGFSVAGKLMPDMLNAPPASVAELIVSGAVPDEVNVTDCGVEVLFKFTLPKFRLVVLNCNPGTYAPRPRVKVWVVPPADAPSVAFCADVTAATVAVNPALVAPAGTVTVAGTVTAALLLERLTASPPVAAAADRVTVQASDPAPVIKLWAQENDCSAGVVVPPVLWVVPLPCSLIFNDGLVVEVLLIVSCPVESPLAFGLNWTATLYVLPAATVSGKVVVLATLKSFPVTFRSETCISVDPWFTSVTLEVEVCPTVTEPNSTASVEAWNAPMPAEFTV